MDRLQYELDEALRWQRGVNNKRIALGREPREPFFMSRALLDRIHEEAIIKEMREIKVRRYLAERQAEREKAEIMALEPDGKSQQIWKRIDDATLGILEVLVCVA